MYNILAHGEVGILDEVIFVGIAAVFIFLFIFGWYKSRQMGPRANQRSNQQPEDE